jgi:predicted hotdog family 3-hydroxylacyl-ACP dehydratase
MMQKPFPATAELLPHKPPMIVVDAVSDAGEDWVEAVVAVTPEHPLFEADEGGLPGWTLIELMAQTIALYGGLKAQALGEPVRIGYLLGTRRLTLNRTLFAPGETLRIRAAMKPISTVPRALRTIDTATGEEARAHHQRSDVCAVPAAGVVAEAMVALVVAQTVLEKLGGDSVAEAARNLRAYLDAIPERLAVR